ncbi:dienelactone hydrolase family protein [Antrihabitans cavernicola]|uniref:Carboxymethylenebutenolidase n=1 Tax=Antrihabitans cavernicola TaxID=2495913 RepID=A0A5A7SG81_9NOCA|nr:dienelactone hydrolase family protein [Spelaeibacter cavernicola]KAA0024584.1 carboxymethylenebutenolidase [Spelaeibacter cavernicola]
MSGFFEDAAPLRAKEGKTADGATVPVTAIEPEGNARGGIVVLHRSSEFTDSLLALMRSLSAEGWIAVAPHLFDRSSDAQVFGGSLFANFDASFDWLTARGVFADCVGALGFDDAGSAAFLVATSRPIGAAVSIAARGIVEPLTADVPALVDAAEQLQAPWLGLYGEGDAESPPEQVEQLRDAVAKAPVATNVVSYAGVGHRADEPTADSSDDVLVDAQTRIFDWFDSNLR